MLIDTLNQENYISYNITLAGVFGLEGAVYCSVLLSIYKKAQIKNKLIDNDYFKVDRKYIYERTRIPVEDQLRIDLNWVKIELMSKHADDPDIIKLDIQYLISIMASEDIKLLDNIRKKLSVKNPRGCKETKRQGICNNLKNGIECSNYELLTALRDWVDAIFANPNNFLSKKSVELFQKTLNEYCKINDGECDLDKALAIVNIATAQGYKNCDWAITYYERGQKMKARVDKQLPRVTVQKSANGQEDLSDEVF